MSRAGLHSSPNFVVNGIDALMIVKERDVLLPRQTHHNPQSMPPGEIEKPTRRHCISSNRVDAVLSHRGKVLGDESQIAIFISIFVRMKRAVGYATDVELLVAKKDKLSAHRRSLTSGGTLRQVMRDCQRVGFWAQEKKVSFQQFLWLP